MRVSAIDCNEVWSFKTGIEGSGRANVFTWFALDPLSRLAVGHHSGPLTLDTILHFMNDLNSRMISPFSLKAAWHPAIAEAVDLAFDGQGDYATCKKVDGGPDARPDFRRVYLGRQVKAQASNSALRGVGAFSGNFRQKMRPFLTRPADTMKLKRWKQFLSVYYALYNFVRINRQSGVSPAVAAGVTNTLWSTADLIAWLEAWRDDHSARNIEAESPSLEGEQA